MIDEIKKIHERLDGLYGDVLYGVDLEELDNRLCEIITDLKHVIKDYGNEQTPND